mmetsp:Transcript_636/g.767  ORF Transcript_636/g.767 Transcript_636/m.767 type:complete len:368 (-) Transcript_636:663-1766(-)
MSPPRFLPCLKDQKKTRKFKHPNSAYQLFLSHTLVLSSGEVDTSGIFSKECYLQWLASRRKIPENPENSFRSALVSHVTGILRCKPFPPRVEASILQRLKKKRVWECFQDTDKKVGSIGFRGKGYHETRRRYQTGTALLQMRSSAGEKRKLDEIQDDIESILIETSNALIRRDCEKELTLRDYEVEAYIEDRIEEFVNLAKNPFNLSGKFALVTLQRFGRVWIRRFLRNLIEQEIDLVSTKLYRSLNACSKDEVAQLKDFLFPAASKFEIGKPLEILTTDDMYNTLEYSGPTLRSAFLGSRCENIIGFVPPLEAGLLLKIGVPIIQETGEIWIRHYLYVGGEKKLLIAHWELQKDGSNRAEMQLLDT